MQYFFSRPSCGRPRKNIPREYLENMLSLKVPISDIARSLGVSRPKIYNAIQEYGMVYEGRFSSHSENELRDAVIGIKENHPNAGEVMVQGHLRANGVNVQRRRIRSTIKEVDPEGVQARSRLPIRRRVYSVPCPNYLWHVDGNHKLIRWRFVLHHGIDGFSRLVTFGRFSDNNRATTVMSLFHAAIQKYGQPLRIRTDYGGENVNIWRNMIDVHGETSHSVIVGSSVHNQRIERHNRAVNEQVINVFKQQFYNLEQQGILDPSNDTDLYCLHYVYTPRLNRTLAEFIAAHNNHKVSTEENLSPLQMFYQNRHLTDLQRQRFNAENHAQGMSVQQLLETTDIPHVNVPTTENILDDNSLRDLMETVDPLSPECGEVLYRQAVQFVGSHLLSDEHSGQI